MKLRTGCAKVCGRGMSMFKALVVLLAMTTAGWAETPLKMTARPEALIVFSDDLRMGARIVDKSGDKLVASLNAPEEITLQAGFWTDKSITKRGVKSVRLRCTARFVMADGSRGKKVLNTICYKGDLADTANTWTLMKVGLRFRPVVTDPAGVMGVELTVTDELSGTTGVLIPTFDWRGGKK